MLVGLTAGKQSETTLEKAIEVLQSMFAQYGLPEQLVSDNGSQFISTEFSLFFKDDQTKHTLSAPYHLASNSLVERFMQTSELERCYPNECIVLQIALYPTV